MSKPLQKPFKHFEIEDDEFDYLRNLIYREAGINLTPAKKCLVQTRIGKLMRRRSIDGYSELFKLLREDDSGQELTNVIDVITTNHTYFFREEEHFNYLADTIIPELLSKKRNKHIRIWSAGCSSGEEPYSIAIILKEQVQISENWTFEIFATDLSTEALFTAEKGIYEAETIKKLSLESKRKYFKKGKNRFGNLVKVKGNIRQLITFRRHNLLKELPAVPKFDIIFCRNVMIYFDHQTKERVVNNISQKLTSDGYFITGHSESLNTIKHPFETAKPTIYKF